MEAGRELDYRIAKEVMGANLPEGYELAYDFCWEKCEPLFDDDGNYSRTWQFSQWPPFYSTNIADAWQVVEKLGFSIWCAGGPGEWKWGAGYCCEGDLLCWSYNDEPEKCLSPICETAPLAICLAALEAVEAGE